MTRTLQDHFFRKAKASGYLARSAYKLEEIQRRYQVISAEDDVLDLGCAPGAWLQVAAKLTKGCVVGVDLKACELPPDLQGRITTLQGDVMTLQEADLTVVCQGYDAVLSDMCHATIGSSAADVARSLSLGEAAMDLALGRGSECAGAAICAGREPSSNGLLRPGGNFLVKLLEGTGTAEFAARLRPSFARLRHVRPEATRKQSREVYVLGMGRKASAVRAERNG